MTKYHIVSYSLPAQELYNELYYLETCKTSVLSVTSFVIRFKWFEFPVNNRRPAVSRL